METRDNADWLVDFASGKLDAAMRAQIEEHMQACPACREFAVGQQTVWQALEDWEPAPVSMDFDRRLYRRIEQQVSWWARLARPLNPLWRHAVPVAAAAGVVLVAGLLMNRPAAKPVAPLAGTEQVETLQPDQVEHALDDMEMVREFSHLVRPDNSVDPKM
jgi:anti-sigma factor RsiW